MQTRVIFLSFLLFWIIWLKVRQQGCHWDDKNRNHGSIQFWTILWCIRTDLIPFLIGTGVFFGSCANRTGTEQELCGRTVAAFTSYPFVLFLALVFHLIDPVDPSIERNGRAAPWETSCWKQLVKKLWQPFYRPCGPKQPRTCDVVLATGLQIICWYKTGIFYKFVINGFDAFIAARCVRSHALQKCVAIAKLQETASGCLLE